MRERAARYGAGFAIIASLDGMAAAQTRLVVAGDWGALVFAATSTIVWVLALRLVQQGLPIWVAVAASVIGTFIGMRWP